MSTAQMCKTPCETCKKEGLPLLLTRYAVHTAESGAPALSGKLGGGPLTAIPLGVHAQYGLRLLRSGYVYVHDEARKHWDEYFVTGDGFLSKLPPRPKTGSRPPPTTSFACARAGAAPLAGVITIRNPKHATNIWIGFSDVEWTDATLERHNALDYRQRHMQKIVVSGGKVAPQPHTAPIEQVEAVVPEFTLAASAISKHVTPWGPFAFNSRQAQAQDFKAAVKAARPQGGAAIVALHDPASIATELDALMTYRFKVFADDPKRQRPLAASLAIQQLEEAIRAQAVDREEAAAEELANQMLTQPDLGMFFEKYRTKKLKAIEDMRTVTPEEAKRAEDKLWESYRMDKRLFGEDKPRFKDKEMKAWLVQYEKELEAFDKEHIVPLAAAHRDWMKCGATTEYFACNFDEADVDNGLTYALTLSLCIGSTQDKAACFDLYTEWLGASTFEKSNLLLNAFALNLRKAKEELQKAAEVGLDWRDFSWDALADSLGKTYEATWEAMAETVSARLVTRAMGPLAKIADHSAAAGRAKLSLVTMSVFAGKPYTVIDVVGSKKRFRELLIKQLIRLSGQPLNEKQLRRAVANEMRRLEIAGAKLDGTDKKRFLIFLDETHIKGMPPNLSAADKVKYAVANLKTIEKIEALDLAHWRTKLGNPRSGLIKGSYPYLIGLIGAIFQYQAMAKLGEDEKKAMRHETVESRWRLYAGMAAFWGTVADLAGQGIGKAAPLIPRVARGFISGLGRLLSIGSRLLGIAGAGMVAYWDYQNYERAKTESQGGMAALYFGSAFLGLSSAVLLLFAGSVAWAGPVALILIGLLIAVSVLIEYFKDNKIHEWLKRCWWGNGPDAQYPDVETEMKQLELAMA